MQEEEEKADRLKRIYEKKMLEKGIEIRGKEDQIQCLFEFNSRDKEIEDKH